MTSAERAVSALRAPCAAATRAVGEVHPRLRHAEQPACFSSRPCAAAEGACLPGHRTPCGSVMRSLLTGLGVGIPGLYWQQPTIQMPRLLTARDTALKHEQGRPRWMLWRACMRRS